MFAGTHRALLAPVPPWVPRAGGVPATLFSDFANNRFWYRGVQSSAASWLAAFSGTFTRASTGYYTNSAGLLVNAGSNVLRFDYDPITLAPKGILLEGARTNICLRSEQFDNASWTKEISTVSADAAVAPAGNTTADKLIDTVTNTHHDVYETISLGANVIGTFSVFVKPAGRSTVILGFSATGTAWIAASFDLTAVAVTTTGQGSAGTYISAAIVPLANGWFRVSITGSVNDGTFPSVSLANVSSPTINAVGQFNYAGDGSSGAYLWGAQLEAGSFPSSYAATTSGSVTRAADALAMVLPTISKVIYVTSDNASHQVSVSPGAYTVPTTFAPLDINSMAGYP